MFLHADPLPVAPRLCPKHRRRRHRTIFISDIHLGTRGCKAGLLADFLAHNDCETLYLIGDIVDGWRLKESWFWTPAHTAVVRAVLRKIEEGARVIYVPGNHDEDFRDFCGLTLAGVELHHEYLHETADSRSLLVIHGDEFDGIVAYARWLAKAGDWAYQLALSLSEVVHAIRRHFGLPYWSLSAYLKHKVKNAASFISNFENALAREARSRGASGVVCGHIHHAEMKDIGGVLYCNDGDWVESCTALVEDRNGRLEILRWTALASEQESMSKDQGYVPASRVAA